MNDDKLHALLKTISKPARYTGGELNAIHKSIEDVHTRVALCFPDTYEVGMSHLGLKILYHILNGMQGVFAERAYMPWTDMREGMITAGIPLYTLESGTALSDFDIVGFTLQYEMSYTNILGMLELSGIALKSRERTGGPIVIAGGPCAFNPEPLADFIDIFVIGDGEEATPELVSLYAEHMQGGFEREAFLLAAAQLPGMYVPRFYGEDGARLRGDVPARIQKRVMRDLDAAVFPDKLVLPFQEPVHDRVTLEVARGCTRGCRFCQAGMLYRPVRERSVDNLMGLADCLIGSTGYEEMSLSSLSAGDYSRIDELSGKLIERFKDERVSVSLPSLRVDASLEATLANTTQVKRTGLTFAPEAGTQRLRDVINKGVTEENLMGAARTAFDAGYSSLKLYFMIGLPTETEADLDGIAALAKAVRDLYPRGRRPPIAISISASSFVPKPHTPFQWDPQDDVETLMDKQRYLGRILKTRGLQFRWHEPYLSVLEADFARGGREMGRVLLKAYEGGCIFDGWSDVFDYRRWLQAYRDCGLEPGFIAAKRYAWDERLPWDIIDSGVTKDFLLREAKRALEGVTTSDCNGGACQNCGLRALGVCP